MFLEASRHAAIHRLQQPGADIGEAGRRRLTRQVGRGADDGAAEGLEEGQAEIHARDAHPDGAVGGQEVGRQEPMNGGEDHRCGATTVEQEGAHPVGDRRNEAFDHGDIGAKDEHRLGMVALFQGIDFLDRGGVGGIAADAPDGIGRIEERAAGREGVN